jgi:hypothetical protein
MVETEKNSSDASEARLDFCNSSLFAGHIMKYFKESKRQKDSYSITSTGKDAFITVAECAGFCCQDATNHSVSGKCKN